MKNLFARIQLASLGMAALLTLPGAARAVDFHVTTAQELQNALTLAAANGATDNIYLTNGYYVGNFNFNSAEARNLTLQAEPGVASDQITIDGAGGGRSMSLSSSAATANFTVRGLTFLRNCGSSIIGGLRIGGGANCVILVDGCRFISPTNSSGMGLELVSGLNATVSGCTATGNATGNGGTGILISGVTGNVSVQNCVVSANRGSTESGGLYIPGASVIVISGNTVSGNSGHQGGAVFCYSQGTVTFTSNTFSSNSADGYYSWGGGVYCNGSGVATFTGNIFSGNSILGGSSGGGVVCFNPVMTFTGNTFTGNSATSYGSGAGAYCAGTTVTFTNNTFTGNSAGGSGGTGGGLWCKNPTLIGNTFTGNSAGGYGGGAHCEGDMATVSRNTFKMNSAVQQGGGLNASCTTVRMLNNLFLKNSQSSGAGGGGVWIQATTLDMINNTLTGNTAAGSGGGVDIFVSGVSEILHVYNNIIWGNTAPTGGDVALWGTGSRKEFLFNDAHDMSGVWDIAVNNKDVAPLFFDPVNGDYHLRNTSACLNAGTNGAPYLPATDLDGGPRIAGGTVDLGCYEFGNSIPHPADLNNDWVISDAEYTAYAAAWKNEQTWNPGPNPIPADYVTRAGYLKSQSGGAYHNDGSTRPVCWKPGL